VHGKETPLFGIVRLPSRRHVKHVILQLARDSRIAVDDFGERLFPDLSDHRWRQVALEPEAIAVAQAGELIPQDGKDQQTASVNGRSRDTQKQIYDFRQFHQNPSGKVTTWLISSSRTPGGALRRSFTRAKLHLEKKVPLQL
jgi:hypothetical protein